MLRDPFFSQFLSEDELILAEQAFDDLERLGAELVDPVEFPNLDELLTLRRLPPASTPAIAGDRVTVPESGMQNALLALGLMTIGVTLRKRLSDADNHP